MMLNSMILPRAPSPSHCKRSCISCVASRVSTEQLRFQLDQLHLEAQSTRAKANTSRLRLLRLSEAAEKIQQRAALCVQKGKEDEARELLFQKKKIVQALQKSKSRIELFDELSSKLNEAISVKETQLVQNTDVDVDVRGEDAPHPVRIVSPKEEVLVSSGGNECYDAPALEHDGDQKLNFQLERDEKPAVQCLDSEMESDDHESGCANTWNDNNLFQNLARVSSYEDFLSHVDQQLDIIETELDTVLKLSNWMLESDEAKNFKAQQMMELQESIRSSRAKIAGIIRKNSDVMYTHFLGQ